MNDYTLNIHGQLLVLDRPLVMGILNATPDSFYTASRTETEEQIAKRARQIIDEGGHIIDVGACSTRPGAVAVSEQEELMRLRQALAVVRHEAPSAILSVDTFRPSVARMAVEEFGVGMVNDISEGKGSIDNDSSQAQSPMFAEVARLGVPYILTSTAPTIREMLLRWASEVEQLRELGVKDIVLDPGFGFGKTLEENYVIMRDLEKLHVLGLPLLVGVSRKSMVWKLLKSSPEKALTGTTALHTIALTKGAQILRVHDVSACVEIIEVVKALKTS